MNEKLEAVKKRIKSWVKMKPFIPQAFLIFSQNHTILIDTYKYNVAIESFDIVEELPIKILSLREKLDIPTFTKCIILTSSKFDPAHIHHCCIHNALLPVFIGKLEETKLNLLILSLKTQKPYSSKEQSNEISPYFEFIIGTSEQFSTSQGEISSESIVNIASTMSDIEEKGEKVFFLFEDSESINQIKSSIEESLNREIKCEVDSLWEKVRNLII